MSNIAKFYQTETHDYENFFKNYESSSKEKELNSLIKGLNEQLENAKVELSRVQNESYNKDFTPNGKTIIVHYASNRSDLSLYFDLLSGNAVDINDYNMKEVLLKEVNLKGGEFWVNVGYCFPLGAACNGDFYTALLEILQNLPNARLFRYVRLKLAFHAQNAVIRKCLCVYLRIIL